MFIHKGKETFSFVNITGDEMAIMYDALKNYHAQLGQLLKLPNDQFLKFHGTNENDGQKVREIYEKRIPELVKIIKNVEKHAF